MGKELNKFQTFLYFIFLLFLLIRGTGFIWFFSTYTSEESFLFGVFKFVSNDFYAMWVSLVLLLLIFYFGRADTITKRFITLVSGKTKEP